MPSNDAFARWDRSHLSVFTLADGRVITDEETGAEMATSICGPIIAPIDIAAAKVARTVGPGLSFNSRSILVTRGCTGVWSGK